MTDIKRYELAEPPLARGGMAYVYDAVQVDSGLHFVMKRPMPFEGAAERLDREAATLARLSRPHVMPILDSGLDEAGEPWYVMPRAKHNLSDYLASRPKGLNTGEIIRIAFDQVASGLQTLHAAGLVHRDVKPENILEIDDDESSDGGRWVVSDLGLVRQPLGETTRDLTGSASMLGTAAYAAPEMYVRPHDVTSAADVLEFKRSYDTPCAASQGPLPPCG